MNRSVRVNGKIGELGGAVASDAAASETMQAKNDVLVGEGPAGISADAAAFFRGIVGSDGAGSGSAARGGT
jgi:hypothetical protein